MAPKAKSKPSKAAYKYVEENASTDRLFQPWWNFLVSLVPMWVAPNVLTVLGGVGNLVPFAVLAYTSPHFVDSFPAWFPLLYSIGVFWHQTFDNLDGKQARRTGSSSPVGEFLDHALDAISSPVMGLSACIVLRAGPDIAFYMLVLGTGWNYCWLIDALHTGVAFHPPATSVTDAQLFSIMIGMLVWVMGPEFGITSITTLLPLPAWFPHLTIGQLNFIGAIFQCGTAIIVGIRRAVKHGKSTITVFRDLLPYLAWLAAWRLVFRDIADVFTPVLSLLHLHFGMVFLMGGLNAHRIGAFTFNPLLDCLKLMGPMGAMKLAQPHLELPDSLLVQFGLAWAGIVASSRLLWVVASMNKKHGLAFWTIKKANRN